MTPAELGELLARFSRRPTMPAAGGRHVYVWRGQAGDLADLLPRDIAVELDLHQLAAGVTPGPGNDVAARRALEGAIQTWLRARRAANAQQVVVVSGCDLLMRYAVSLGVFFQAVGDSRMVILVAPPLALPSRPLPRYVELKPTATADYLRSLLSDAAIVA